MGDEKYGRPFKIDLRLKPVDVKEFYWMLISMNLTIQDKKLPSVAIDIFKEYMTWHPDKLLRLYEKSDDGLMSLLRERLGIGQEKCRRGLRALRSSGVLKKDEDGFLYFQQPYQNIRLAFSRELNNRDVIPIEYKITAKVVDEKGDSAAAE